MKAKTAPTKQRMVMHRGLAIQMPKTFKDVLLHSQSAHFQEAMREEVYAIFDMGVLEPVYPVIANTKKPIQAMMTCDEKVKANGRLDKYKARLVMKGFAEGLGVDFSVTWAPVNRLEAVRSFLAGAATKKLIVYHVDVKTAFLSAEVFEEIYVRLHEEIDGGKQVSPLRMALYGLKQASKAWYLDS
jgi:hypothetical protein